MHEPVPATRFGVLGPLEVWSGSERVRLGGAVQARVLAALLLEPGRTLPLPRLVQAAWPDHAPGTAAHQIRKAVAELRRRLPDGREVICTDGPGYRAEVGSRLDLVEFDSLVAAAGRDADPAEATRLLTEALALWRGPALAGLDGAVVEAGTVRLDERRLAAAEQLHDLRLRAGDGGALVGDLQALVREHPLRETLRAQLMLALHHTGRTADALAEYERARTQLADELGLDPGAALAAVHQAILCDSPEVAAPPPARAPASAPPATPTPRAAAPDPAAGAPAARPAPAVGADAGTGAPCTLPMTIADFGGRETELAEILRRGEPGRGGAVAVDGMGGVGKTSLTVHAAHRLAASYPDGQLYVDLRGYTPDECPVPVEAALDGLLRSLDVPADRVPDDLAGKAALWRSTLARRSVLVLLDNVAEGVDISPLLPAAPRCLTLVTSRMRLFDLDGAHWITLDTLSRGASAALLTTVLGEERVAAEPAAVSELAELCGDLPLALRIAAARLRNRPRWTVAYLVERLRDETRRLDELSVGERSVATTVRLSYLALDEHGRRALRLLAGHPGRTVDVWSAAAVLDLPARDTADLLESLVDVTLLQQPVTDRYAFHDLVRSFAVGLTGSPGDDAAALAATGRLLDYHLAATDRACDVVFPDRTSRPVPPSGPTPALPPLATPALAQEWLAREDATIRATVRLAHRYGLDRQAAALARNQLFWLHAVGQIHEFADLGRLAVAAARRTGDLTLLSTSLSNLGLGCWKLGLFREGTDVAQEALDTAIAVGDRSTEAHSLGVLGLYHSLLGDFDRAHARLTEAVTLERELGTRPGEVESLTSLSTLYEQRGRWDEAADSARSAWTQAADLRRPDLELVACNDLAAAELGAGRLAAAAAALTRARDLAAAASLSDSSQQSGHEALTAALSALLALRQGDDRSVAEHVATATTLLRSGRSPLREAKIANILGQVHLARGDARAALHAHLRAHEVASVIRYRAEQAYGLEGAGLAHTALGDADAGRELHDQAERLFRAMGVPAGGRRYSAETLVDRFASG